MRRVVFAIVLAGCGSFGADVPGGDAGADGTTTGADAGAETGADADATGPCENRGLSFDGTASGVSTNDATDLDELDAFTIEAWVKVDASLGSNEAHVLSHHDHGKQLGYVLMVFGTLKMRVYDPNVGLQEIAGADVPTGVWTHIAGVRTAAGQQYLFVNGQRATQKTGTIPPAAAPGVRLAVGGSATNREAFRFAGLIDEVRLSKVARYTTDFARPTAPLPADGDTVALYRLDETAATTLRDATKHGHDLTSGKIAPQSVELPCFPDFPPP